MDSQRRGPLLSQKRESRKKTRRQKKKFEKSEADYHSEAHTTGAANKNPLEWTNAEKQERERERETLLVIEAENYRKMFLDVAGG